MARAAELHFGRQIMDSKKALRRKNKLTKIVERENKSAQEIKLNTYDQIEVDGKMIKTEPSDWVLVKDGVVDNIIHGHPGYIETIREHYDHIFERDGVDKRVGVGWLYDRKMNAFSDPNPKPEKVHKFVNPEDANNIGDPEKDGE